MKRPEPSTSNRTGLAGLYVAACALVLMLCFLIFDWMAGGTSPYLGAVTFLLLPALIAAGCALVLLGGWLERRRLQREGLSPSWRDSIPWKGLAPGVPARHATRALVGLVLALPLLGLMTYEGYHFTESNEFCGVLCHGVMHPEYTAYQASPHARVDCVACHIGEGADWFVKAKISGIRQVFTYALDIYETPIPPALTELRPARETCEQCHWPAKFHGDQLLRVPHFASDEENTERTVTMMVKTGGADPMQGEPSGIHWHMALGKRIEYVATDDALQVIPWMRVTSRGAGESKVYRADGAPSDAPPPEGTRRVLDCMDCHNRPTHVFLSPNAAVNRALSREPALATVPYAKARLVQALSADHASQDEALAAIESDLEAYYRDEQPDAWAGQRAQVEALIALGKQIYERNIFPEREADWSIYPNNIGHMESPGCFRCHDERHVDGEGVALTRECRACHDFLVPTKTIAGEPTRVVGSFEHAYELEGPHALTRCDQCHSGGPTPPATCTGCHADIESFRSGELAGLELEADSMWDFVACTDCHDPTAHTRAAIAETCTMCHDPEYADMPAEWRASFDARIEALEGTLDERGKRILSLLEGAGPQHNVEAARTLLDQLEAEREP